MHGVAAPTTSDPCDYSQIQSTIKMGDEFLKSTVQQIMSSTGLARGLGHLIQWDESDYPGSTSVTWVTRMQVAAATRLPDRAEGACSAS